MAEYFQDLQKKASQVQDPNIGFQIFGRRFVNPLGNKESNVRDFLNKNGLSELDKDGSLSGKLANSAPNDWNEIAQDFANRNANIEGTRIRAKKEALGDRAREADDVEALETRQQARNTAAQRAIMDKQLEGQKYTADTNLKGVGMQVGASTKQAEIAAAAAARQAQIQGQYSLEGQRVAGQYGLEGQRVAGQYNLEGAKVGARAQVQTAQIGAQSARDVANISGGWNYRGLDLTSGRELTNSREQRMSDERKQTQEALASRQEMGERRKREEASELLQARLQRGDSGRNFLLSAVQNSKWFR